MMKAVIDRFEGDFAIILCGKEEIKMEAPKKLLPEKAKEGDCLNISFEIDPDETERRREMVRGMLDKLMNK